MRDVPRGKIQTQLFYVGYVGAHINILKQSVQKSWGYWDLDLSKKIGPSCFNPKALIFELSKRSYQKGNVTEGRVPEMQL